MTHGQGRSSWKRSQRGSEKWRMTGSTLDGVTNTTQAACLWRIVAKENKNQCHCQSGRLIAGIQRGRGRSVPAAFCSRSSLRGRANASLCQNPRSTLKRRICVPNWLPDIDKPWLTHAISVWLLAKPSLVSPALVICLLLLLGCLLVIWTSVKVVCLLPCGVIRPPLPNLGRLMGL